MDQRLSIVTLGVSDISVSERFYSNKLGWKKSPDSQGNIIFYDLNGIKLALYPRQALAEDAKTSHEGSGFRAVTLAYNARSEAEVDTLFKHFEEAGINIVKSPEKAFWGGYSGYFADPDGHLWEVAHNPFVKIDEQGNLS